MVADNATKDNKGAGFEPVPFPDMPSMENVTLPMLVLLFENMKYDLHDLQLEHERMRLDYVRIKRCFREYRRGRFGRY